MRGSHVLSFIALTACAHATTARSPASGAEEETVAARANLDRFVDSWNRADGPAYGENYWPEAELVDPTGTISQGREAIIKLHEDLWAGPFKGSTQTGSVRSVRRLGPDYMVVDLDLHLHAMQQLPPGVAMGADGTVHCNLKHILEKRAGVWRIIYAQNTFIAPR